MNGNFIVAQSRQPFLLMTLPEVQKLSIRIIFSLKASPLSPVRLVHGTQFRTTRPLRALGSGSRSKCISHSRGEALASTTFNMLCASRIRSLDFPFRLHQLECNLTRVRSDAVCRALVCTRQQFYHQ